MVERQDLSARELAADVARALRPLAGGLGAFRDETDAVERSPSLHALVGDLRRLLEDLEWCAGRQALATETLRPAPLLAQFAARVQPLLGTRLALRVRVDAGCPPCRVDARALEDALLRLVVDARAAARDGATVALTVRSGRLDDGSAAIEFAAVDDSPGVSPEPGATAVMTAAPSRPHPSSALGRAAVEGFARQSGGCLRLERDAAGTRAWLVLPCAQAPGRDTTA